MGLVYFRILPLQHTDCKLVRSFLFDLPTVFYIHPIVYFYANRSFSRQRRRHCWYRVCIEPQLGVGPSAGKVSESTAGFLAKRGTRGYGFWGQHVVSGIEGEGKRLF